MNNPYYPDMNAAAWRNIQSQPEPYQTNLYAPAYPVNYPVPVNVPSPANQTSTSRFVKGALAGALIAYILTNENVQQSAIKTAVRAWSFMQGGVEEMKEKFRDAEAELHADNMAK